MAYYSKKQYALMEYSGFRERVADLLGSVDRLLRQTDEFVKFGLVKKEDIQPEAFLQNVKERLEEEIPAYIESTKRYFEELLRYPNLK